MKQLQSLLFLAGLTLAVFTQAQSLIPVSLGYSKTSVNTAIFRADAIVTFQNTQFIAFYDEEEFLVLGKRNLNSTKWELKKSQYKGNCSDAHNIISLMVDGDGYLHVAFDHHGHPLKYCRSTTPLGLEVGELLSMTHTNENNVTYPEFYKLSNGDLLFVYRDGASGRGNLVMNRYNLKDQAWSRIHDVLIDGENQRNAYWQIWVDSNDYIHISWVWRESWMVETNHDLCYAFSQDGGKTWLNSKKEVYTLPINAENAEYIVSIPENSELINQTSMVADQWSNPYIATYWRDQDSDRPQYRIVWFDGKKWNINQVYERKTSFTLSGGGTKRIPISRPKLVVNNNLDSIECYFMFRDEDRLNRVSIAYTPNLIGNHWNIKDYTTFTVDAWEPNFDTNLWKEQKKLHLFIQRNGQGDGERKEKIEPQPIYVLEID